MNSSSADSVSEGLIKMSGYIRAARNMKKTENLELEARIGSFKQGKYQPIKPAKWARVYNYCKNLDITPVISNVRSSQYKGGYRLQEPYPVIEGEKISLQLKRVKETINIENWWTRLSLSSETETDTMPTGSDPEIIRYISRHSFNIANIISIDLSKVRTKFISPAREYDSNELELEFIGDITDENQIKNFGACISTIIKEMNGSMLLYSKRTFDLVGILVNNELIKGIDQITKIDRQLLTEARNITVGDLRSGGLINGKFLYDISDKAEGFRIMLIICKLGIWLVSPPFEANLISLPTNSNSLYTTILDCELIPNDSEHRIGARSPGMEYWVKVIDGMVIEGIDIRLQKRPQRYIQTQLYVNDNKEIYNEYIEISMGMQRPLTSDENPFEEVSSVIYSLDIIDDIIDANKVMKYKTDGVIFTPSNREYGISCDVEKRTILKWKDIVTVDLRVEKIEGKIELKYIDKNRTYHLFTGSKKKRFDNNTMIDTNNQIIKDAQNGAIVEFMWDISREKMVPLKFRHDKNNANVDFVAISNWNAMAVESEIITKDAITGNSNFLMKKYHNMIKSEMIADLSNLVLLDIGSGRGADVGKWSKAGIKHVFCVEPDTQNIKELNDRLDSYGMLPKVTIIKTIGENYKLITRTIREKFPNGVDVISMMDSLTFFWESPDHLENLKKTIHNNLKQGGKFIWKALNGSSVRNYMENNKSVKDIANIPENVLLFKGNLKPSPIYVFKDCWIIYDGGNQIRVSIPPWVGPYGQIEWLTDMFQFKNMMEFEGEIFNADKEIFMSKEHRKLSALYSYGTFTYGEPSQILQELKTPRTFNEILNIEETIIERIELEQTNYKTIFTAFMNCIAANTEFDSRTIRSKILPYVSKRLGNYDENYNIKKNEPRFLLIETICNGLVYQMYGNELISLDDSNESIMLYQPENIINNIATGKNLDEIYCMIIAEVLGFDLYILEPNKKSYKLFGTNAIKDKYKPSVIIISNGNSYDIPMYDNYTVLDASVKGSIANKYNKQATERTSVFNPRSEFLDLIKTIAGDDKNITDEIWNNLIENDSNIVLNRLWYYNDMFEELDIDNSPFQFYLSLSVDKILDGDRNTEYWCKIIGKHKGYEVGSDEYKRCVRIINNRLEENLANNEGDQIDETNQIDELNDEIDEDNDQFDEDNDQFDEDNDQFDEDNDQFDEDNDQFDEDDENEI